MNESFPFDLFISYSTDPDYRLVRQLEKLLESFHELPTLNGAQFTPLRICVDGSDFKLPHPMEDQYLAEVEPVLNYYLSKSKYLLVCCSKASRTSRWVAHEFNWFLRNRGPEFILLGVTEGFDRSGAPEQVFSAEIIDAQVHLKPWYDFRGFDNQRVLESAKVRDPEDAWLSLAAHLKGLSLGEVRPLWLREKEKRKVRERLENYATRVSQMTQSFKSDPLKSLEGLSKCEESLREFTWELFVGCGRKLRCIGPGTSFAVSSVAFSRDGKFFASGGGDFEQGTELRIWEAVSLNCLKTLRGHNKRVSSLAFLSRNSVLVSGGMDGRVAMWSIEDGRQINEIIIPKGVTALAVSFDDEILAVGDEEGETRLLNLETLQLIRTLNASKGILDLAFSPDQKTIAIAADKSVVLWDIPSGRKTGELVGHTNYIWCVAYSPEGDLIVSGGADQTIRAWDAASHRLRWISREPGDVVSDLTFSPDSSTLAAATRDGLVTLWVPRRGIREMTLRGHRKDIYSVAFSHDGEGIVSGGGDKLNEPGEVILWHPRVQPVDKPFHGHRLSLECVALSPTQPLVATGAGQMIDDGSELKLWDIVTGAEIADLSGHTYGVSALAFSPDGSLLASGSGGQDIRLWDLSREGKFCESLARLENTVNSLAFNPSGNLLAASTFGKVIVFDLSRHNRLAEISTNQVHINDVVFSPDGALLAFSGEDSRIVLWDVQSTRQLGVLDTIELPVQSLSFSEDGRRLVSAGGDLLKPESGELVLWDIAESTVLNRLEGHFGPVRCVQWSPDGRTVASGGSDRTLILWEPTTGRSLASLDEHEFEITDLAFSKDGRLLISVGGDGFSAGEVRRWSW